VSGTDVHRIRSRICNGLVVEVFPSLFLSPFLSVGQQSLKNGLLFCVNLHSPRLSVRACTGSPRPSSSHRLGKYNLSEKREREERGEWLSTYANVAVLFVDGKRGRGLPSCSKSAASSQTLYKFCDRTTIEFWKFSVFVIAAIIIKLLLVCERKIILSILKTKYGCGNKIWWN